MNTRRVVVSLGSLCFALTACSGVVDGRPSGAEGSSGAPTDGAGSADGGDPEVCVVGVPATSQIPRLLNRQYQATVRDLLGVDEVDGSPVSELLVADFDGPMTSDAWRIYQDVGDRVARSVMAGPNRARFITCDPAEEGCLESTIRAFGRRAFRRPVTDDEVARFQRLTQTDPPPSPEEAAEATLFAFLVSPSFLMLPELQAETEPGTSALRLSSYEVATRLSFMLWGSVPDDELDLAADRDELRTKEQLLTQARRMIAVRERTGPLVASFHRSWAQMNNGNAHWWKGDHDTTRYPLYSAEAKDSWRKELDAFFENVAFDDGSFEDLLLSNVAYVNQDNAALYGLDPEQFGETLTRVTLDAQERPGFLTRAGFLSSYSGYDATSPILRGAFISTYLLGVNPGPPIPGATMMTVSGDFDTQREYVEALTAPDACSGCHAVINPIGYVLEGFDALGGLQDVDPRGGLIDATVTTATVDFGDGKTREITSPLELMEEIAQTPKARELYAQAWVAYAYGRSPNGNDRCVVEQLNASLAQDGYGILDLLADLTQADSFRLRKRETP